MMAYITAAGPRTSKLKRLRPSSACRHGGLSVAEVVDAVAGVQDTPATAAAVATVLGFVFVGALGSAIVASVLVHLLGRWIGVPVAAVVVWLAVVRPRTGLAYLFFDRLRLADIRSSRSFPSGRATVDDGPSPPWPALRQQNR